MAEFGLMHINDALKQARENAKKKLSELNHSDLVLKIEDGEEKIYIARDAAENGKDIILDKHCGEYDGAVVIAGKIYLVKDKGFDQASKMPLAYFFGK